MSASELDDFATSTSIRLREVLEELLPAQQLATREVMTTLSAIFERGNGTHARFLYFLRVDGPERTIRILQSKTWRMLAFGFMRGECWGKGSLVDSRKLLDRLPDMIRNRQALTLRLDAARTAYRQAAEREDRQFFEERAQVRNSENRELSRDEFIERQLYGRTRK